MQPAGAALEFRAVDKTFANETGPPRVVLRGLDLSLAGGETIAVIGRSGTGKSTLLHLAAGIDRPSAGEIFVGGRSLAAMGERARTLYRREMIGLVFQFFHLLPWLSVAENVALPEMIAGGGAAAYRLRVQQLLARVGLADRAGDPASKLSGGEMQRVAICRALMRRPRLLLADEPTGNLDDETSRPVMQLLLDLVAEEGSALLYVTHSEELAGLADSVLRLQHGRLRPA